MKEIKITLMIINIIAISTLFIIYSYDKKVEINPNIKNKDNPAIISSTFDNLYIDTNVYYYSDSKYEEQIINKNTNGIYKLIGLTIDNYNAYLIVVYKPESVKLMTPIAINTPTNIGLEKIVDMTKRHNAILGINGGGFVDTSSGTRDIPSGYMIKDGKVLWGDENHVGELIGFDKNHKLTLVKQTAEEAIASGIVDAIEFGPFLIVNGQETINSKWMYNSRASRVIIAQRKDGIVLFLVTNGGSYGFGPKMEEIVKVLKNYGAYNAANLDGGASTQLVINGKLYSTTHNIRGMEVTGGRRVLNGWGIIDN